MSAAELLGASGSVPLPDGAALYTMIGGLLTALITTLGVLGAAYISRPPRPDAPPAEHRAYAESGARPRGSRGVGTKAVAVSLAAGLGFALFLLVAPDTLRDRSSAEAGTTTDPGRAGPTSPPEVTAPPTTPDAEPTATPAAEPTITPEDEVEQFLGEWTGSFRKTRDPETLAQFWHFPGDWFNQKDLQDVSDLVSVLPKLPPPGPRPCARQLPEVESVEIEGTQVSVTARVRWEATEPVKKQGSSTVMYELERTDDGQPFRIRKVSEPPKTPPACK